MIFVSMAKILFIESDSVFSDIYQRKFVSSGFEFEIAASKTEALQKVLDSKFDIILLDLVLQEESGMDILKELRTNPLCDPKLKIVIFSGPIDRTVHKQALDFGVRGFLAKLDYPPARLVDEMNRFLHQFEEQRKNEERFRNGGPIPKNKKVLLVENEDVFIDMFGKRLRDEGYEVEIAINGNEGFSKAAAGTYDLIITDMIMPGLDGKGLIKRLKNDDQTKNIPIFLFSASVGNDVLDGIRRDGIRCFMKTHITPSELVREVNAFLE